MVAALLVAGLVAVAVWVGWKLRDAKARKEARLDALDKV